MVPQWDIQNVTLSKNEKYIRETDKCFWKAPEDVNNRSQKKNRNSARRS